MTAKLSLSALSLSAVKSTASTPKSASSSASLQVRSALKAGTHTYANYNS